MPAISKYSEHTFESIKHINEYGQEYWLARELQHVLEYTDYRNFELSIFKAMEACKGAGIEIENHFGDVTEMVAIGSGAQRALRSYQLSRYACYLIVMNGNPRKEVIAVGQTYFAVKTRQQELIDNYDQLSEDQKRLAIRNEMIAHNKSLAEAAQMAGIVDPIDYAIFQNKGYQGLYGGLGAKEIHARKGLKKSQQIPTIWAARNLQLTFSAPLKPMKNCVVNTFRGRNKLIRHITRLAERFGKPLLN